MRPRYETASDLAGEAAVADELARAWGVDVKKVPVAYGLDHIIMRPDGFIGWVEIKRRGSMIWGDYPDVMVSLLKIRTACVWGMILGKPVYFVVRDATGELRAAMISTVRSEWVRYGGRTLNTRDAADIEPVAHIPLEEFKPIEGLIE